MIRTLIRELCALSIFCGAALSLAPEGTGRKAMRFVCSVVLLACAAGGIRTLDFSDYAVSLSREREREQSFLQQSEATRDALDQFVIEKEYEAYIRELCERNGFSPESVFVKLRWSTEGLWVPEAVRLRGSGGKDQRECLARRLSVDLGIPIERQEWIEDG